MPPADDQPWSPFPVQDWSTLPADPLGSVAVNPTWPAPEPQRSWWRPLVVFALVAALVAGAAFVASSVGVAAQVTAAADYLPSDGAVSYERTDTTHELKSEVGLAVTESARLSGVAGLLSTDGAFASKLLAVSYPERDRIQILRTITTAINDPTATAQTIRFYRVNAGVELMGLSTPSEGYVYDPALVVLPAEVRAGSRWGGAGSAGDTYDYRSELSAEASGDDCLNVKGEVRYHSKKGQLGRVVTISQTWCQREGLVAESQSFAAVRTASSRVEPPVPSVETTANSPIRWAAPQRWTAKALSTISINPTFGQEPMVGSPSSAVASVRTESGLVIRPTIGRGDLVATTPKTLTEWTSIWRAHPGGSLLSLSTFGDVIIATTSNRQMVAYSDVGVRLWQLTLDDLAPTPPVRISESDAVLVDLAGAMRKFDLGTGAVLWQQNVGSDVNLPPAAGAGVVVVMDRGGTTTAFEEATGKRRWSLDMQGNAAAVIGETVVVIQDQTAHALSTVSGRHRWVRPIFGTLTDMVSFAGQFVVATKSQSVMLSADGVVTQRLGPVLTLTPAQDHLLAWGPTEALVIARDGKIVTRWKLPALTLALQDRPALATSQSVLLFSNDWTFQVWDDVG
ncbi:MAG TPA: PQQ-binding-like beta-propeller repeat protein [Propionibacteriaceae bacterium]|nr:PQQ-binding-like beta-propeller repeat protein [Propionibacteriaceae bacterium]